jgi:hypothetical protein
MRLPVLRSSLLLAFPACQLAAPSHFEWPEIQPANPQLSLYLQSLHREGYSLRN